MDRLKSVAPSLAKLGKKLPTKEQLETAWGSGECAVEIPLLNLDLHEAIVQGRQREMMLEDAANGIDLSTVALDFSKLPFPHGASIEPEQIEAFAEEFLGAINAAMPPAPVQSGHFGIKQKDDHDTEYTGGCYGQKIGIPAIGYRVRSALLRRHEYALLFLAIFRDMGPY